MNRLKSILFLTVLLLIGGAAGVLAHANAHQRLGQPGVKTRPLGGSKNLEVLLPENVPGYVSKWLPQDETVTNLLPRDTSYGQRLYTADNGLQTLANVVLMGSSRASIHKPQICLTAQGWTIDESSSREDVVHMEKPVPYDLLVMRLNARRDAEVAGQTVKLAGVYVYWFVDADRLTASHVQRFLWMAQDVLVKGEVDRWAYIAFFTEGAPGQEDAMFEREKKLMVETVPEFQLVPQAAK
jgi:hypothetical protein